MFTTVSEGVVVIIGVVCRFFFPKRARSFRMSSKHFLFLFLADILAFVSESALTERREGLQFKEPIYISEI